MHKLPNQTSIRDDILRDKAAADTLKRSESLEIVRNMMEDFPFVGYQAFPVLERMSLADARRIISQNDEDKRRDVEM